jgi:hypothetical protein
VRAIATLESTEGILCRPAYSELVAATCDVKKVLPGMVFPCRNKGLGHGTVAPQSTGPQMCKLDKQITGEWESAGSLADPLEGRL